jgi:hypothetical protein
MNRAVRSGRFTPQAVQVFDTAPKHLRARGGQLLGRGIRARKAGHLMPRADEFFHDCRADKSCGPVTKTRISNLLFMSIYCVEVGKDLSGNLQRRSPKILAKMLDGGCARNQQDVGGALKKPGKRNLHWCGLQ